MEDLSHKQFVNLEHSDHVSLRVDPAVTVAARSILDLVAAYGSGDYVGEAVSQVWWCCHDPLIACNSMERFNNVQAQHIEG